MSRFRSILSRVVALHVVTIGVISIVMPLALYWLLNEAANGLHRDALHSQAVTISGFLKPRANGVALDIPPEMEPLYAGSYGLYAYAVLDSEGHVLFVAQRRQRCSRPRSRAPAIGRCARTTGSVLFGVSVSRTVDGRTYLIQVAQDLAHRDVIIDDIVASFFPSVAWITFPLLLALLLIDILIFRRALKPVREASTTAATIGPTNTEVRLPEAAMPTEVVPLVPPSTRRSIASRRASCSARVHRRHGARAAHAAHRHPRPRRSLEPGPLREELRKDLENMTRIVNQVLDIAELEASSSPATPAPTCRRCASRPWPSRRRSPSASPRPSRSAELSSRSGHGHAEALFRAVRNLIENAIRPRPDRRLDRGRGLGRRHRARARRRAGRA